MAHQFPTVEKLGIAPEEIVRYGDRSVVGR